MIDLNDDVILANNMRNRAYVKYSQYSVGAVLTTKNGKNIQDVMLKTVEFKVYVLKELPLQKQFQKVNSYLIEF